MTKMLALAMCTLGAVALDAGKDLLNDQASLSVSGMRDNSGEEKAKAQGRSSEAKGRAARSQSEPTFQWTGVSISDDQNFCARMTPILGDYQDLHVTACTNAAQQADESHCTNHYEKIIDGNAGDIKHCRWTGTACEAGAVHNCTWSFYMEDLITKHNTSTDNCASRLLEAKRSLDGLLHSVQDVYNQLMQWNAIVQAENSTIRGLLEDQQNDWDDYVSEQQTCDSLYSTSQTNLQQIENEMTELRAIANPDVRSAVDVRRARGYQESAATGTDAAPTRAPATSFVEMDESACQSFSSLVERVRKTHGEKITVNAPANCHEARSQLETDFKNAFKALGQLYNQEINNLEQNRSICLNEATYDYKAGVEGIDGIDDQIQDAAGKIHEAQGEIARLEPMLHDVERAVNRMRTYVQTITDECGTQDYLGHLYKDISDKIVALQECPGRNDFIIDVPHWRPLPSTTTPAPTPWFEDPKADATRSIL